MRSLFLKRIFDIIFSISLLILLSPLIILISILILIFLGSPVFFCQQRPGKFGKPFIIYKFRTMRDLVDPNGNTYDDEIRLTRFGRFLRSTSIDEIPELINVLKGNMSFVGPRPLMMEYLAEYSPEQHRRHEVKPGITGLAQINGRNMLPWEERFKLDVWYVDNWSLWLDFKILLRTLLVVFTREGINEEGFATASTFINKNKSEINN